MSQYPPAVEQAALVVEADVDAQQVRVAAEVVPLVHVDAVSLVGYDLSKYTAEIQQTHLAHQVKRHKHEDCSMLTWDQTDGHAMCDAHQMPA